MSTLTDRLRHELLDARRGGHRAVAATLRATLASLANAEAVPLGAERGGLGEHVAGLGTGATEAERRRVSEAEQVSIVQAEIAELADAATTYDGIDPARAADARSGMRVLERVLADHAG